MKKQMIFLLIISMAGISDLPAQQISTRYDVFNFEVGDQFQITESAWQLAMYTDIEILERTYVPSEDFLLYVRAVTSITYEYEPNDTLYSSVVDTIVYTGLQNQVFGVDTVFSDPQKYFGRQINRDDYSDPGYYMAYQDYIVGCGGGYFVYEGNGGSAQKLLTWYKKGDEEWGEEFVIVGQEEFEPKIARITISPNPVYGDYFNLISAKNQPMSGQICNISGQVVKTFIATSEVTNVSVSGLPGGLYFISLECDHFKTTEKVVIR